jgi:hypothetical protein
LAKVIVVVQYNIAFMNRGTNLQRSVALERKKDYKKLLLPRNEADVKVAESMDQAQTYNVKIMFF